MDTMLQRMRRVYGIIRRAHGIYVVPLFVFCVFGVIRLVVGFFMTLDNVFFPRLGKTKANRPIVLVGNPRTGTTFLQRFLSDHDFGKGMELFLMLYPSLILQKFLRPFLPLLEKVSPAKFHSTEAHETSLSSVETDDVGVLFRYMDGLFLYGFFLTWDDQDWMHAVDPKIRDTSARDFAWLDKLWRRSLIIHNCDRNVAKLFSLSLRLPRFIESFPEARILYMARDPLEVIPSSMSMMSGVLDRAFGFWSKPEEQRNAWLEKIYTAWIMLFKRFHEEWTSGAIKQDHVFVVRYDRMMGDFDGMMEEMCVFLDHEMTPELRQQIRVQADKQRAYTSGHKYDLAKFGLSEERIRKDCAFFYDTFLPPMDFKAAAIARNAAQSQQQQAVAQVPAE